MKYISTRNCNSLKNFKDIIYKSISSDGGLYVPYKIPKLNFKRIRKYNFRSILRYILKKYTTNKEYKYLDFKKKCKASFKKKIFKISKIKNREIFHISEGESYSFKDVAIKFLSKIYNKNIACATSGDTGSSCNKFFKKKKNIFVISPFNRTSFFQRKQMFSNINNNFFNISILGNFDNCQDILKNLKKNKINTLNSVNWLRILIQSSYYIYYFLKRKKRKISIPTGNFGNAYSCFLSIVMGANYESFNIITNENNVLFNFFKNKIYDIKRLSFKTDSPSMDITKSSNLERYLYYLFKSTKAISKIYKKIKNKGVIKIKKSNFISSLFFYKNERFHCIKRLFYKKRIIIDPHTSNSFLDIKSDIIIETAKYFKFFSLFYNIFNIKKIKFLIYFFRKILFSREKFFLFNKKEKKKIRRFIFKNLN
ncbi:hypothetical protein [Candidatus Vidania fulgoroideorum]